MATQPTQNPVPSESPRDLKFNAGKIDEFVTSLALQYIDRFGQAHFTIEGLRQLAQQAIAAFGWIPMDSFQDGATLTLPNQILRDESTGEYYRWDGALPKSVAAGSTPASSGGVGEGAWISVGDSALRTMLASSDGAALIGYKKGYVGEINTTAASLFNDRLSVTQFGVIPNGTDITAQLCAALDAANGDYSSYVQFGQNRKTLYIPTGTYTVDMTKLTGLHKKVGKFIIRCNVECLGQIPSGDFVVLHAKTIRVSGLSAKSCTLQGIMHCTIERLRCPETVKLTGDLSTPDPAIVNWGGGSSWNTFIDTHVGTTSGGGGLLLSPDNSYVTHNTFIQTSCAGLAIGAGTYECHANTFINLDTSGAQFNPLINSSTANQCNLVIGWYDEVTGTGRVVGNWNIIGGRVNQRNWQTLGIMNSALMIDGGDTGQSGGDFLSSSVNNMCEGGEWGVIGGDGVPVGLTKTGNAPFSIANDTTEPSGSGRRYGSANNATGAVDTYFIYSLGVSKTGRVRGTIFVNGVPDQISVGNSDGTNVLYQDTTKFTALNGTWRLYRVSGTVDANKECRCTILSKAGNLGLYVGGAFFTPYNVCPLPAFPGWNKTKGASAARPTYISDVPVGFTWYRTSTSTTADPLFAWVKRGDGTLGTINCSN